MNLDIVGGRPGPELVARSSCPRAEAVLLPAADFEGVEGSCCSSIAEEATPDGIETRRAEAGALKRKAHSANGSERAIPGSSHRRQGMVGRRFHVDGRGFSRGPDGVSPVCSRGSPVNNPVCNCSVSCSSYTCNLLLTGPFPPRVTSIGSGRRLSQSFLFQPFQPGLFHPLRPTLRLGQHLPLGDGFCHRLECSKDIDTSRHIHSENLVLSGFSMTYRATFVPANPCSMTSAPICSS